MESPTYSEFAESSADIHSVLLSRHGSLCYEYHRKPEYANQLHALYSITKSVVSIGVWLLVKEQGESILHQPVVDFCQDMEILTPDPRLQQLTLHHLLSQTSGLRWKEMGIKWGMGNPLWEMEHHHDWISYVLNAPFATAPGRHFNYNSGASHLIPFLMGRILKRDVSELFHEELLFPLGIDRLLWESDPQGNPAGGKGLHLRPMDLLHFGHMILRGGIVGKACLVSEKWIETCLSLHSHGLPFYGEYGYQWWLQPEGVVVATGFGGQNLFIDRKLGLVFLCLGNLGKMDMGLPLKWFEKIRKDCIDGTGKLV